MNFFILLCAAMFAADDPAQVQAKVLYGTADETQNRADMELWISQAVAKSGSPLAQPYTNWIALTGEQQELYSSMQGGRVIKAQATEREGKFKVEVSGFKIKPLEREITLKPGERRVVQLTDYLPPGNVFIALEAPLSEQAKKRAEAMKAGAKSFHLELNYNGQEDKPFYRLIVSVPAVNRRRNSPFSRIVQIKEAEANEIIDHLARIGFLDRAVDQRNKTKMPPPMSPGYTMTAATDGLPLIEDLGWGLPMIERIESLGTTLPDAAKKDMDLLLGRLSGLWKQWEAEPTLDAKVNREDSHIRFLTEGESTVIAITSEFGIDKATVRRKTDDWPKSILVRLHLNGLESFIVLNGRIGIEWSVSQEKATHVVM